MGLFELAEYNLIKNLLRVAHLSGELLQVNFSFFSVSVQSMSAWENSSNLPSSCFDLNVVI